MGIRKYKPTTPGRRGASVVDFVEITRDRPEKFSLATPGEAMPDRSPLMSAAKTGTPTLLRASAISWRVLVLPVPVAPATSPCRLNIDSGMRMGAATTGAPSISTPSCTASPSNPYPA